MASRLEKLAKKIGVTDLEGLETPARVFSRLFERHPQPPVWAAEEERRAWVEKILQEVSERALPTADGWQSLYDELSLIKAVLLTLGEIISIDIFEEGNRIQTGLCVGRFCFVDRVTGSSANDGLWVYKKTAGEGRIEWNRIS